MTATSAAWYIYTRTVRIVIYHTNDIHGRILPEDGAGGFAVLASVLKRSPRGYLLIDSGDFFQGTPEGDLSRGDASLECMNSLGYTACALGDHDFDPGEENLNRLSRMAKFPFLSANLRDRKTGSQAICMAPCIVKELGGIKVGIIGLTTHRIAELSLSKNMNGLAIQRETDALIPVVKSLKEKGVEVIILAAHVGMEGEKYIAAHVPGIHLILGGHTHSALNEPFQDAQNKTLIVHNVAGLRTVTKTVLRVWKDSGKLFWFRHWLIPLSSKKFGEDEGIKDTVESYEKKFGEPFRQFLGTNTAILDGKDLLLSCDVVKSSQPASLEDLEATFMKNHLPATADKMPGRES